MNKYLVTGCAGFIASNVTKMLIENGNQVVGIDNLNDAYDVRLKEWRLETLSDFSSFEFRKINISDQASVQSLFESIGPIDAVVNLAARAGVRQSVANPQEYVQTNILGTVNLLEACKKYSISKFLLASTSSLYAGGELPYQETADTNYPLSPYSATKKGAEAMCHTYHHLSGIDISIPRYFTVYGPFGRPEMSMFRFIRKIVEGETMTVFGDGSQQRDFTFVDDIARGTIAALRPVGFETFNLGGKRIISLNDMIAILEDKIGKKAQVNYQPFHAADIQATQADTSKAEKLLDWQPEVTLEQGIEKTIEWYMDNRDRAKTIDLGE